MPQHMHQNKYYSNSIKKPEAFWAFSDERLFYLLFRPFRSASEAVSVFISIGLSACN
jgi:hypothetical protein